jgi:hypothetical protein
MPVLSSLAWADGSEPALRGCHRNTPFMRTRFQQVTEPWMLINELIDQVVALAEGNELKRRLAIDGYDHRLVVTELCVSAQLRFGFTQRNNFHGRKPVVLHKQGVPAFFTHEGWHFGILFQTIILVYQ